MAGKSVGCLIGLRLALACLLGLLALLLVAPAAFAASPANDDFAQAQELSGEVDELPGSTLEATKELGEPEHAGNPGGTSVWYAWTAADFQLMVVEVCSGGWTPLVGVYNGGWVDALDGVASSSLTSKESNESCRELRFRATSEATYRIAVDGYSAGGAGEPKAGSFELNVRVVRLTGPPKESPATTATTPFRPPVLADTVAPNTSIRKLYRGHDGRVGFQFAASDFNSTFSCRLDRQKFTSCKSPKVYRGLPGGWHRLSVKATDTAGNVDLTPATRRFRVK